MIVIRGARGRIPEVDGFLKELLEIATKDHVVIQVLDAKAVYGREHLVSAAEHALRSWEQGTNATNTLALEILLYAAGERQIQKAIKKMGVKPGQQSVAFILVDTKNRKKKRKAYDVMVDRLLSTLHMTSDEKVLEGTIETLQRFGIMDRELRTVPLEKYGDLILEKVAMVDVWK